jgi:hypothetical protein
MESRTNTANATAVAVRNGKCFLKSIKVEQRAAAAAVLFLQIFNVFAPTVGTTTPVLVIPIPAGSANVDVQTLKLEFQGKYGGLYLDTAFAYAVTTTYNGSTNPTAGQEPAVIAHYENLG